MLSGGLAATTPEMADFDIGYTSNVWLVSGTEMGYRSTFLLPDISVFLMSSSIIIIGGGITALFTAWFLRKAGFSVQIIYKKRLGTATQVAGGYFSIL